MARGAAKPKGWYRDPTGRHDLRRWDGDGWSEWVMDGGRRSFDDIDGCGGPPRGDLVVAEGPTRKLPGRGPRPGVVGASAGPGHTLLPSGAAASATLPLAAAAAMAAAAVASAVVALGERDLLGPLAPGGLEDVVRLYLLPIVMATVAFQLVAFAGLGFLRRGGGVTATPAARTVLGVGRDEMLRGLAAFLLALFARTFLVSALTPRFAGIVRPIGPWWLFAVEAAVLVLVAPVVEERLFRGTLLTGLRHRTRPVVAILGQAAIYGAAYAWLGVGTSRFAAGLGAAAVGAVFGWFTHTTDDLRPVVVGHALLNVWFTAERLLG